MRFWILTYNWIYRYPLSASFYLNINGNNCNQEFVQPSVDYDLFADICYPHQFFYGEYLLDYDLFIVRIIILAFEFWTYKFVKYSVDYIFWPIFYSDCCSDFLFRVP